MSKSSSSRTSFFSFGPGESIISKSFEGLRYRSLPPALHQLIHSGSVVDVHWASLGPVKESWVLSYVDREGKTSLGWGAHIPSNLIETLKSLKSTPHFRVFLGPDESFVAWDTSFIRWVGLPPSLEAGLQSWLTPSGWKAGPPRLVTWGVGNVFFAISEYGEVKYRVGSGSTWPLYADTINEWNDEFNFDWSDLVYISLDPTTTDQFIAIRQDRTWAGSIDDYGEEALESFALNFFHLSKKKSSKSKRESRTSNVSPSKDSAPDAVEQAIYEAWATTVASTFSQALTAHGGGNKAKAPKKIQIRNLNPRTPVPGSTNSRPANAKLLTEFPYVPPIIAACAQPICASTKADPNGLRACRHDVERLLRASGLYSYEWLRQERIRWHPDRFGRLCEEQWRETGKKLAEEMFKIIDGLITDLEKTRTNMSTGTDTSSGSNSNAGRSGSNGSYTTSSNNSGTTGSSDGSYRSANGSGSSI